MKIVEGESLARLRHDLKTPVNHILGYTELLIEDAGERHLEAFFPVFQQIQRGGGELLETIQNGLGEKTGLAQEVDLDSFRQNLGSKASEVLGTCTGLLGNLERGDPQTLADLEAISHALRQLIEFSSL
jgi:signal transduction histidine kinase